MALLFMDGFDAGDFLTKWNTTSSAITSSTITPHSTGRSVEITSSTSELERPFTASAQITIGFAVQPTNSGSAPRILIRGDAGETSHLSLTRNTTNGFLELRRSSTLIATGTISLAVGAWYYVEIQATIADAGGTVKVRVNGSGANDIDFTGDTRNGGTSTNIDYVRIDSSSSAISRIDDVYILNSVGSTNNTFLGNVRVHTLSPNANGTYSQLTGSDGNQTDNYQLVDELPSDTADYTSSSTATQRDTYNLTNLATGITQVLGLQSNFVAGKTDAGQRGGRNTLLTGGNLYYGASRYVGLGYRTYSDMFETNPATTAIWTKNQVDELESGVEVV